MERELLLAPGVSSLMEERAIRKEDLQRVLAAAEESGRIHVHEATGRELAYATLSNVTYWVEYERKGPAYRIVNTYSHRMKLLEGYNMASKAPNEETGWRCAPCDRPLAVATVKLAYMEETFAADLPSCPACQHVFISEETATVKMALAERMLEDK